MPENLEAWVILTSRFADDRLVAASCPVRLTGGHQLSRARQCALELQNGRLRSVDDLPHLARLQPHRTETFKLSNDPLFVEKVRDIVGLYLSPPERAVALSVDETSQIQVLDRSQPLLPMRPGQVERRSHDIPATAQRPSSLPLTSPPARLSVVAIRDIGQASSGSSSIRSKLTSRATSTCTW